MASSTTLQYSDITIEAEKGTGTVDLSGSSNSVSIDLAMVIGEARVFNDPWPQRTMQAKDATIDLAAWFSTAADEAQDYFADWYNESLPISPRTITFYIPQKSEGSRRITADWVFTGMKIDSKAGDTAPISMTTQLKNAGTVTIDAYTTAG